MKRLLGSAVLAAMILLSVASVVHARKAIRANPPVPEPSTVILSYDLLETKAIQAARRSSVHAIDTTLADERFDEWFGRIVGPQAKVSWEMNDCGEQSGSPNDSDIVIPTCVQAQAEWENSTALVWLMVGTEETGINLDAPEIFYWEVDGRYDMDGSSSLSEFGRAVQRLLTRTR